MRKLVLWLMLFALVIVPGASWALESSPVELGKVGLFKVYSTNEAVVLGEGKADYSSVTEYYEEGQGAFFGAAIKGRYTLGQSLPAGALISKIGQYPLYGTIKGTFYGSFIRYASMPSSLAGTNVRWSLNSSPASIGSTVVPPYNVLHSTSDIPEIANVVPYVKLVHGYGGAKVTEIKVYFVESGDTEPVTVSDISGLRISVNGNIEGFSDLSNTEPAVCIMSADLMDTSTFDIYVDYDKGENTYVWKFTHPRQNLPGSYIIWEQDGSSVLASDSLSIRNESIDVKITLSGDFSFQEISVGSNEFVSMDYETHTDSQGNDVVWATLTGKKYGYTTLRLKYSKYGEDFTDIRRVSVASRDRFGWSVPLNWTEKTPLIPYVKERSYDIRVYYAEGRPYYETAACPGTVAVGFTGGNDSYVDMEGIIGVNSSLYSMVYEGNGKFSIRDIDNRDKEITFGEYDSNLLTHHNVWIEAPGYEELNGITSFDTETFITSRDIIKGDFVPYAEIVSEGRDVKKIKWSLINHDTKEVIASLPDGMQNLHVWHSMYSNGYDIGDELTVTSGEYEVDYTDYQRDTKVYFSYSLDGIAYQWLFRHMPSERYISDSGKLKTYTPLIIPEGKSLDVSFDLYIDTSWGSRTTIEAISIPVGSSDIISVDLVSIDTSLKTQGIRIYGKTEGTTSLSIILQINSSNAFTPYYQAYGPYLIKVGSDDEPVPYDPNAMRLVSSDLDTTNALLIEGKPYYYDRDDNSEFSFTLRKNSNIRLSKESFDDADEREKALHGFIYVTNEAGNTSSQDVTLNYRNYSRSDNVYLSEPYYTIGRLASGTTLRWNFPVLGISGEDTVTYNHVRSALEQYNTYMPHVELVMDGMYATGIKWYFADSNDVPVRIAGIKSVQIGRDDNIYYDKEDTSGDIVFESPIPVSAKALNNLSFTFMENDIKYSWKFSNVSNSSLTVRNGMFHLISP